MSLQLLVIEGPDKECRFTLQDGPDLMLGRSPSVLYHLRDPTVDRAHCQVIVDGDQVTIVDEDSTEGTFVNGTRIRRHTMKVGDVLKIGNTLMQLQKLGGGPLQRPPESGEVEVVEAAEEPLADLCGQKLGHYQVGARLGE